MLSQFPFVGDRYRIWTLLGILTLISSVGCAQTSWNGQVDRWGSLREVLKEGDTSGKIDLRFLRGRSFHAVGALAELQGEIAVVDGLVRVSIGDAAIHRRGRHGDEAAFLVAARVREWDVESLPSPFDLEELVDWVRLRLSNSPWPDARIVPIRIQGEMEFEGHVLAGYCPHASARPPEGAQAPLKLNYDGVATIIGFYSDLPPGEVAHHGSSFHLHAVSKIDGEWVVSHVDQLQINAGAELSLPAGAAESR